MPEPIEPLYPLTFRKEDAKILGEHLRNRDIVELVGAKRVGISNFLRFFLYHTEIVPEYISKTEQHMFIPVDLNDLVERNTTAFWIVMFKRLLDTVEISITLPKEVKEKINARFLNAIQLKDLFMTIEEIRNSLQDILRYDIYPTFFFIRFDRLIGVAGAELFSNLQGLRDATDHKVSFVFTSFRRLEMLFPEIPTKDHFAILTPIYLKPAREIDMRTIYQTFQKQYHLDLPENLVDKLLLLSGGHVQYLQLFLIILHEKYKDTLPEMHEFVSVLEEDERIRLLSEEIWESLGDDEKEILLKIVRAEKLTDEDMKKGSYLWDSGIITQKGDFFTLFSSLFQKYLSERPTEPEAEASVDFTKKEHLLFTALNEHMNEICERELIIELVWPEYEELGVSDWTIDRLIARLRTKLKKQNSPYTIITVKTRGYKLVKE